jgi:hypothetical protein
MFLKHKELFRAKIFSPFLTILPRYADEGNIKTDGTKIEWEDVSWIHRALIVQWQAHENMVMNFQDPQRKNGNFFIKFGTKLVKILLHGVSFDHTLGTLVLYTNLWEKTFRRFDTLTY